MKYKLKMFFEKIYIYFFVKKYPWLRPRYLEDYDYTFHELSSIPNGWYKVFGKQLIKDIDRELKIYKYIDKFEIAEVKEKFGQLRIYHNGAPGKINEIIDNYSYVSEYCCIECGKPDVGMTKSGWVEPICKHCWEKFNKSHKYEDYVDIDNTIIPDVRCITRFSQELGKQVIYYPIDGIANNIRIKWKNIHPIRYRKEREKND